MIIIKFTKAIIFDFDGVIHDTFDLAYKINIGIFGEELTEEKYRDFFNGNIFENKDLKKKDNDDFFKLQNEAFKYLKIDENIKNNLEKLYEKYALFIISSNQEKALNIYFQNNKFTHIFKEMMGSETHQSKVEKFKYLFEKYKLDANDCVFVTDTLGDILEGNKVGIKTIAVDFGFHKKDRLEKGKPFKIVSSFDDVIREIEKM
ncbi:MAG: HAD hydrolase-like protein [Candidatus Moranbacteria bacterium]|jgi:phosphoglycolate phosphatase-like HAD superfamily hydrolase|nr:HAD hydrolase-like protein [Candidatus Moranbacteria bacterium]